MFSFVLESVLSLLWNYFEDVVVEEKIDQGKSFPFMLVVFACMMYLFCLISF